MRRSLSLWMGALVSACLVACATVQDDVDLTGVRTDFLPDATLSMRELRDVVKLANQCGVNAVGKVSTYLILPSPMHGIAVTGVETIREREVTFTSIDVNNERWTGPPDKNSRIQPIRRIGKFWAAGDAAQEKFTRFHIHGEEVRVILENNASLPLADRILKAFADGRIRYRNKALKATALDVNFSKPARLSRTEGSSFSAVFGGKGSESVADCLIDFTFENDVLLVSRLIIALP